MNGHIHDPIVHEISTFWIYNFCRVVFYEVLKNFLLKELLSFSNTYQTPWWSNCKRDQIIFFYPVFETKHSYWNNSFKDILVVDIYLYHSAMSPVKKNLNLSGPSVNLKIWVNLPKKAPCVGLPSAPPPPHAGYPNKSSGSQAT